MLTFWLWRLTHLGEWREARRRDEETIYSLDRDLGFREHQRRYDNGKRP